MLYKKAFDTFEADFNSSNVDPITRNFKNQFEEVVKFLSNLNINKNNYTFNKKDTVKEILQIPILNSLSNKFPDFEWDMEYKININVKDSIDIIGMLKTDPDIYQIIIELDNERGDQISKKFVSRMALTTDRNTGYITLCYPSSNSTAKAGKQETNKYSSYMSLLSEVLHDGTNFDKLYAFIKL